MSNTERKPPRVIDVPLDFADWADGPEVRALDFKTFRRVVEELKATRKQLEGAVGRIKALRANVDPTSDDVREAAYARGYLAGVTDALERLAGGQ